MALTAKQKSDVVFFLGWSGKSIVEASTNYNSQVADRLINLTTEIEAQVISLLGKLLSIDAKLESASCRLAATEVNGIKLNANEIHMLRTERKRLAKLLSSLLDIPYMGTTSSVNVSV